MALKLRNTHKGKHIEGVIFPVAPNLSEMGGSYLHFIEDIKKEIQKQRVSAVMNANTSILSSNISAIQKSKKTYTLYLTSPKGPKSKQY